MLLRMQEACGFRGLPSVYLHDATRLPCASNPQYPHWLGLDWDLFLRIMRRMMPAVTSSLPNVILPWVDTDPFPASSAIWALGNQTLIESASCDISGTARIWWGPSASTPNLKTFGKNAVVEAAGASSKSREIPRIQGSRKLEVLTPTCAVSFAAVANNTNNADSPMERACVAVICRFLETTVQLLCSL